ncbi:MAG: type II toxin-antitoxin system prevent-host-death family antitoxin [Bacillota bacterium]
MNRLVVDQSEARHTETVEEIGAYEAKTRLSELLARVSRGERITLTRRGVPVAMLVPVTRREPVAEVVAELRAFRKGRRLGALSLRELIEAGRKW